VDIKIEIFPTERFSPSFNPQTIRGRRGRREEQEKREGGAGREREGREKKKQGTGMGRGRPKTEQGNKATKALSN
jgi:hypothetical protein